ISAEDSNRIAWSWTSRTPVSRVASTQPSKLLSVGFSPKDQVRVYRGLSTSRTYTRFHESSFLNPEVLRRIVFRIAPSKICQLARLLPRKHCLPAIPNRTSPLFPYRRSVRQ